jgi:hypothetical protein
MKALLALTACFLVSLSLQAQMPDDKPRIDDHFQRWKVHYRVDLKEKMNIHLQLAFNTNYWINTDAEYNDIGYEQRYGTKAFKYRNGLVDALIKNLIEPSGKITKAYLTGTLNKEMSKDEATEQLWKFSGLKTDQGSSDQ